MITNYHIFEGKENDLVERHSAIEKARDKELKIVKEQIIKGIKEFLKGPRCLMRDDFCNLSTDQEDTEYDYKEEETINYIFLKDHELWANCYEHDNDEDNDYRLGHWTEAEDLLSIYNAFGEITVDYSFSNAIKEDAWFPFIKNYRQVDLENIIIYTYKSPVSYYMHDKEKEFEGDIFEVFAKYECKEILEHMKDEGFQHHVMHEYGLEFVKKLWNHFGYSQKMMDKIEKKYGKQLSFKFEKLKSFEAYDQWKRNK